MCKRNRTKEEKEEGKKIMKWDVIKKEWEYREPKFWSKCTFLHHHKSGLYFPDEQNCICEQCHIWWATGLNRHERSMPPMYRKEDNPDIAWIDRKDIVNEPFYLKNEVDGFIYPNPEYTEGEYRKWLNGKGVALKRERYPDD